MAPPLLAQCTSYIPTRRHSNVQFVLVVSSFTIFNHLAPRMTAPVSESLTQALDDHQMLQHNIPSTTSKIAKVLILAPTFRFAQVLNLGHQRNIISKELVQTHIDRLQVFVACQNSLYDGPPDTLYHQYQHRDQKIVPGDTKTGDDSNKSKDQASSLFASIAPKLTFLHTLVLETNTKLSEEDFIAMGKYCRHLKHLNLQFTPAAYRDWVCQHVLSPPSTTSTKKDENGMVFSSSSSQPHQTAGGGGGGGGGGTWRTIEEFIWQPTGTSSAFDQKHIETICINCLNLRIVEFCVKSANNCDDEFYKLGNGLLENLSNLEEFSFRNLRFNDDILETIGKGGLHRMKTIYAAGGRISDSGVCCLAPLRHSLLSLDLSSTDIMLSLSPENGATFACSSDSENLLISDVSAKFIVETLVNLKRLNFSGRKGITSSGLKGLGKNLKNLETLALRGTSIENLEEVLYTTSDNTDSGFLYLCPKLKELVIGNFLPNFEFKKLWQFGYSIEDFLKQENDTDLVYHSSCSVALNGLIISENDEFTKAELQRLFRSVTGNKNLVISVMAHA